MNRIIWPGVAYMRQMSGGSSRPASSGLTAMGLPKAEIPLALLLFNVGVEIGQIAFVLLVVLLERSFRQLEIRWPRLVAALPGYAVGSLGAFWTIQRLVLMAEGG